MTHTDSLARSPGGPGCNSGIETKGTTHALPFLSEAALAATLIAAPSVLASFTDHGPIPPRRERLLVASARNGDRHDYWVVDEYAIRPDGSRRFLSRFRSTGAAWSDAGTAQLVEYLLFLEAAAPLVTPAQKKQQIEQEAIDGCCGVTPPGDIPCEAHCGCVITVETRPDGSAGSSSANCICATYEESGECPDDWPPQIAY